MTARESERGFVGLGSEKAERQGKLTSEARERLETGFEKRNLKIKIGSGRNPRKTAGGGGGGSFFLGPSSNTAPEIQEKRYPPSKIPPGGPKLN